MKTNLYRSALILSMLVFAQSAFADVKIKSKQTMSGQSYENTTYIKGMRQRTETMGGMMVNLTQCDLRRSIEMNPQAKTYVVNEFGESVETVTKPVKATKSDGVISVGGKVTTTITTKDTGERKQMFGFTARHLVVTMETVSSPDACSKNNSKIQTDGWYIDAEFVLDCDYGTNPYTYNSNNRAGGCRDKYESKQIGSAKHGYPVYEETTMFDESGKDKVSFVNEVTELSKATLDASLFDIPQDYRAVSDASQMYSAAAMSVPMLDPSSMPLPNSGVSATTNVPNVFGQNQNDSTVGPKKVGAIRIGLAGVKTGGVGDGLNSADLAAAVQNTLIQYLKVPNLEVVTLDAKLATAIDSEAKQKECDFVIYSNVSHKKGGGGFGGMFGSALGSAVGSVGIGHTGSTIGNIAGQVATKTIVSATSVSSKVRSKDEITLDLKLNKIDGSQALAKVYRAKARSDGEDIISGVIEQAAQAIVDTVGR